MVPATVTVHLLSRARLAPLVGKGRLLRKGKRLAVAEGEVTQDGQLVAKATVQFAVLGKEASRSTASLSLRERDRG